MWRCEIRIMRSIYAAGRDRSRSQSVRNINLYARGRASDELHGPYTACNFAAPRGVWRSCLPSFTDITIGLHIHTRRESLPHTISTARAVDCAKWYIQPNGRDLAIVTASF